MKLLFPINGYISIIIFQFFGALIQILPYKGYTSISSFQFFRALIRISVTGSGFCVIRVQAKDVRGSGAPVTEPSRFRVYLGFRV